MFFRAPVLCGSDAHAIVHPTAKAISDATSQADAGRTLDPDPNLHPNSHADSSPTANTDPTSDANLDALSNPSVDAHSDALSRPKPLAIPT